MINLSGIFTPHRQKFQPNEIWRDFMKSFQFLRDPFSPFQPILFWFLLAQGLLPVTRAVGYHNVSSEKHIIGACMLKNIGSQCIVFNFLSLSDRMRVKYSDRDGTSVNQLASFHSN